MYDCQPWRSSTYAQAMLNNWQGMLVVDGYAGYRALFDEGGVERSGMLGPCASEVLRPVQGKRAV
ncbi:IS66 family transposase [Serratia symbiotica]|nr:IS66 family transposase [Serratia symbiotica]